MLGVHTGRAASELLEKAPELPQRWGRLRKGAEASRTQSPKAKAESVLLRVHSSLNKPSAKPEHGKALPSRGLFGTERSAPASPGRLVSLGWSNAPSSISLPGPHLYRELLLLGLEHTTILRVTVTNKCHRPSPDFHPVLRCNSLLTSKREGAASFSKIPHHCPLPSFSITKLPGFCCVEDGHLHMPAHVEKSRVQVFSDHQEIKEVVLFFFLQKIFICKKWKA